MPSSISALYIQMWLEQGIQNTYISMETLGKNCIWKIDFPGEITHNFSTEIEKNLEMILRFHSKLGDELACARHNILLSTFD